MRNLVFGRYEKQIVRTKMTQQLILVDQRDGEMVCDYEASLINKGSIEKDCRACEVVPLNNALRARHVRR